jgi:hypothetical protein
MTYSTLALVIAFVAGKDADPRIFRSFPAIFHALTFSAFQAISFGIRQDPERPLKSLRINNQSLKPSETQSGCDHNAQRRARSTDGQVLFTGAA